MLLLEEKTTKTELLTKYKFTLKELNKSEEILKRIIDDIK